METGPERQAPCLRRRGSGCLLIACPSLPWMGGRGVACDSRRVRGVMPASDLHSRPLPGPVTLLILDGFGDGPRNAFDATFQAGMPAFNDLRRRYACTQLVTGGEAV